MDTPTYLLAQLPYMSERRADLVIEAFPAMFKGAVLYTIPLAFVSFCFGLCIALTIAWIRTYPVQSGVMRLFLYLARAYVSAIRGTPILVQLFIVFYGLPNIGIKLEPLPSACLAFSLNVGAYASETIRGAILSIDKGQWDAGRAIGMNYLQIFFRIVIPQALRVAIPPLTNSFIDLLKGTSLAGLVLVPELFKQAQNVAARSYEFMLIYVLAALMYWVICFGLTLIQGHLERRFSRYVAR